MREVHDAALSPRRAIEFANAHRAGNGAIAHTATLGGKTMAVDIEKNNGSLSRLKKKEAVEFRLIFMLIFPVFLAAAILARLIPGHKRSFIGAAQAGRSVIGEARAAANTCIPFAFMR